MWPEQVKSSTANEYCLFCVVSTFLYWAEGVSCYVQVISFFLSLTYKSRGGSFGHKNTIFLQEQKIGSRSKQRVIIAKCQVNSKGLSSFNWEQISPDGNIFNTLLSSQSPTARISKILLLIYLLPERSILFIAFPLKMCIFICIVLAEEIRSLLSEN